MPRSEKIEILAPAGAFPQLEAAVRSGTDAVYLSLSGSLNARRGAAGFTAEELCDAVSMCHEAGTAVHLTLNTLVYDEEKSAALTALETACDAGVDAVIVQDVGLASLIRTCAPDMPMHASTQMTVHSRQALFTLRDMGFSRAVLSRELSGSEIAEITKDAPIETEVFVHGALCMSMSGQCLFSSILGGRSGNRGLCAQPCRLPFTSNGFENCLSLKDMSHIGHIPFFKEAGVASLKIEGRLKRPEYVAAAVTACRLMRDTGSVPEELRRDLENVFSRSGFTDGYFTGRLGRDMFGVRTKEDSASNETFASLHSLYRVQAPTVPLDMTLTLSDKAVLEVTDGVNTVTAETETGEGAALTEERAGKQLSRMGGTPYFPGSFTFRNPAGASMATSGLNEIRRNALSQLSEMRKAPCKKHFSLNDDIIPAHEAKPAGFGLFFSDVSQVPGDIYSLPGVDKVFLPLESDWTKITPNGKICAHAPRTLFCGEERFASWLESFKAFGGETVAVQNIGQIPLVKSAGLKIYGGFSLNAVSSESLAELERLGVEETELSFEITSKQISTLGGKIKRYVCAYGRIPMMLTRNCPASLNGCQKTGCSITDRRGETLSVRCRQGASEIFNCLPLSVTEKQRSFSNIDGFTLHFTTESREECEKIIRQALHGEPTDEKATNGLYFRQVQ